jgi:uncharacterized radical SAM superfamily Fe-S cluster-containing enzyme
MKEYYLSFWFMCDNHTFIKPKSKKIEEIKEEFIKISKNNPYGIVCSVTIIDKKTKKDIGKIGRLRNILDYLFGKWHLWKSDGINLDKKKLERIKRFI